LSSETSNFLITQSGNRIDIKNWNLFEFNQLPDKSLVVEKIYCQDNLLDKEIIYEFNQSIDQKNQFIILDNKVNNEIHCNKILFADKIYKNKFFKIIDPLNSKYTSHTSIPKDTYLEYFYAEGKTLRLKKKLIIFVKNKHNPKNKLEKIIKKKKIKK